MEKANVLSIEYIKSDTVETQGKRKDIERYLKKGYYIKEQRNGYWVLVKSSRVDVTLNNSECTKTFNMKEDIREYYNRDRVTEALIRNFSKDVKSGKIVFTMDSEGMYSFI